MDILPIRKPPSYWPTAMNYLVRRDADLLREFYSRSSSFFDTELAALFERGKNIEADSDQLDFFIDERDEIESFVQENRYFALLRAWGNYERIRDKVIVYAAELGWLPKNPFIRKDGTVNPHHASDALTGLGMVLAPEDKTALDSLREKRHAIVHHGARVESVNPSGHEMTKRLEVSEEDVKAVLELSSRLSRMCVDAFARYAQTKGLEEEA